MSPMQQGALKNAFFLRPLASQSTVQFDPTTYVGGRLLRNLLAAKDRHRRGGRSWEAAADFGADSNSPRSIQGRRRRCILCRLAAPDAEANPVISFGFRVCRDGIRPSFVRRKIGQWWTQACFDSMHPGRSRNPPVTRLSHRKIRPQGVVMVFPRGGRRP
jgi:hypothetical protein